MCKFILTLQGLSLKSFVRDAEGRKFPALDIFTQTIRYLRDSFLTVVQTERRKIPDSDIYYVLTTPAIWSEKAKAFMRKAGEQVR